MGSPDQLGRVVPGADAPQAPDMFPSVDQEAVAAAEAEAAQRAAEAEGKRTYLAVGGAFAELIQDEGVSREATDPEEPVPVEPSEVAYWMQRSAVRVRDAGSRGTWEQRRDTKGRNFAGERPLKVSDQRRLDAAEAAIAQGKETPDILGPIEFTGRYQGPASIKNGRLYDILDNEWGVTQPEETVLLGEEFKGDTQQEAAA